MHDVSFSLVLFVSQKSLTKDGFLTENDVVGNNTMMALLLEI